MAFFVKVLKEYEKELQKQNVDKEKVELLKIIVDDIMSFRFVKRESVRRKLDYFIKVGFDYNKVAEKFNTSKHSLYVAISRFDNRIVNLYEKMFYLIKEGKLEEARDVYVRSTLTGSSLDKEKVVLSHSILDKLNIEDRALNVASCKRELILLKIYSRVMLDKNMSKIDLEKLSHVIYVYCSDDPVYDYERKLIQMFIEDELDIDSVINALDNVKGYKYKK